MKSVLNTISQIALPNNFEVIAAQKLFVITKKILNPSICGCGLYQYHGYVNNTEDTDFQKEGMFVPQHSDKYDNHFDCYLWFYLCKRGSRNQRS